MPPTQRTVVDFYFGSEGSGPTADQIAAVERAGGRIVHRFKVPRLRAEIDVEAVPGLVDWPSGGPAHYARTVPDPGNRDVQLIVMLSHDLTEADIAAVEALGGRIRARFETLDGYGVEIDDAAVPQVRALPGVRRVSANSIICLA